MLTLSQVLDVANDAAENYQDYEKGTNALTAIHSFCKQSFIDKGQLGKVDWYSILRKSIQTHISSEDFSKILLMTVSEFIMNDNYNKTSIGSSGFCTDMIEIVKIFQLSIDISSMCFGLVFNMANNIIGTRFSSTLGGSDNLIKERFSRRKLVGHESFGGPSLQRIAQNDSRSELQSENPILELNFLDDRSLSSVSQVTLASSFSIGSNYRGKSDLFQSNKYIFFENGLLSVIGPVLRHFSLEFHSIQGNSSMKLMYIDYFTSVCKMLGSLAGEPEVSKAIGENKFFVMNSLLSNCIDWLIDDPLYPPSQWKMVPAESNTAVKHNPSHVNNNANSSNDSHKDGGHSHGRHGTKNEDHQHEQEQRIAELKQQFESERRYFELFRWNLWGWMHLFTTSDENRILGHEMEIDNRCIHILDVLINALFLSDLSNENSHNGNMGDLGGSIVESNLHQSSVNNASFPLTSVGKSKLASVNTQSSSYYSNVNIGSSLVSNNAEGLNALQTALKDIEYKRNLQFEIIIEHACWVLLNMAIGNVNNSYSIQNHRGGLLPWLLKLLLDEVEELEKQNSNTPKSTKLSPLKNACRFAQKLLKLFQLNKVSEDQVDTEIAYN